jgi:hypothetical protein
VLFALRTGVRLALTATTTQKVKEAAQINQSLRSCADVCSEGAGVYRGPTSGRTGRLPSVRVKAATWFAQRIIPPMLGRP